MKNVFRNKRIALLVALVMTLSSCQAFMELLGLSSSDPVADAVADPVLGSTEYHVESVVTGGGARTISIDIGGEVRDVYYLFTNSSGAEVAVGEGPATSAAPVPIASAGIVPSRIAEPASGDFRTRVTPGLPVPLPVPELIARPAGDVAASSTVTPSTVYALGDPQTFKLPSLPGETRNSLETTLVSRSTDGTRYVYIWLHDDWVPPAGWSNANWQLLAEKFLTTGAANDIYDWVTGVFGAPWGTHGYANLIPATEEDIHILFYNIVYDIGAGTVVGFYSSGNNYLATSLSTSNERLMFFMHADQFAYADDDGTSWSITDSAPKGTISTLSHEFQHMINFYQVDILHDTANFGSDSWLNEMCSMIAEDFVAEKLDIAGPRGVDPVAGPAPDDAVYYGRIPGYLYYASSLGADQWDYNSADVLGHYAVSYSFGAYLSRTYGAGLFSDILQQQTTVTAAAGQGENAVMAAVALAGDTSVTFDELIRRWGLAMFISDDTSAQSPFRVNSGDWIESSASGVTYRLGSINAHNYGVYVEYSDGTTDWLYGPFIYNYRSARIDLADNANAFFLGASNQTGMYTDSVTVPAGVTLSVVSKVR